MKPVIIMENWKLDVFQEIWSQSGTGTLELSNQGWRSRNIFCMDAFVHGLKAAAWWTVLPCPLGGKISSTVQESSLKEMQVQVIDPGLVSYWDSQGQRTQAGTRQQQLQILNIHYWEERINFCWIPDIKQTFQVFHVLAHATQSSQ